MGEKNQYKTEVRCGPTYRYIHKDCGRRVKRISLKHSHMFVCENCDENISKHLSYYAVDKVRTA